MEAAGTRAGEGAGLRDDVVDSWRGIVSGNRTRSLDRYPFYGLVLGVGIVDVERRRVDYEERRTVRYLVGEAVEMLLIFLRGRHRCCCLVQRSTRSRSGLLWESIVEDGSGRRATASPAFESCYGRRLRHLREPAREIVDFAQGMWRWNGMEGGSLGGGVMGVDTYLAMPCLPEKETGQKW